MKKYYKKILFLFLIFGVSFFAYFLLNNRNNNNNNIELVLKTENYSYLPKEAKEYIKKVYEETGEVILTEKNKKNNTPYLNPQYVSYLQLSDKKKEKVSLIPKAYSVDYNYLNSSKSPNQNFPESYNLENVNGKNYTSPMYNQGNLGNCWAFATVENAESFLMVTKDEPRNENSTRFSVRQMDYANSTDGIKNYDNPWGFTVLGNGGNYITTTTLMANGLTLASDDYMPYNESLNKRPLHEILNYENSLYELNETVNLPTFGKISDIEFSESGFCEDAEDLMVCIDEKTEELKQRYINIVKEGITNYGGAYLAAYSPTGKCGVKNTDGHYILDPNQTCYPHNSTAIAEEAHSMQIIGWDDNYEYSYCLKQNDNKPYSSTVNGTCNLGVLKQGKGAWLVKNSWGDDEAAYIYLTYESIGANYIEFSYITSLSKMEGKNWDNSYNNGIINDMRDRELTQTFEKKHSNIEKIQKIKFQTMLMNQSYNISVKVGNNTYTVTDSFQTEYPGLYTVDVSDKNIFINSGEFEVTISGSQKSIYRNSISVFTKNEDDIKSIITEEEKNIDFNNFTIYSETRNIPSNSQITYELYNGNEKIENIMQVSDNIVATNKVNTDIILTSKLEPGTYRLVQKYGDTEATTLLNVGTILDGSGTVDNPFKIYNEEDLKFIYNHLDYHYELENDIELTEEWVPIGTKENPFTGSFNGKNHKIINLQVNDSTLEYAGFFGYVKDSDNHKTVIKNIYLINPNIVGGKYVGGLIGGVNVNQTGEKTLLIDSIYIIGGTIEGEEDASALVADISGFKKLIINCIFSSATIEGRTSSSFINYNYRYNSVDKTIISNIENIGIMYDNNIVYDKTSLINAEYSHYYSLSNYISTGYSKKGLTINKFYDTPVHNIEYNYNTNGYVLMRTDSTYEFPNSINKVSNISDLKVANNYSEWGEDFDTYWKIEEVDGIKRIPLLKGVDLDYTEKISDININYDEDISLSDYYSSDLLSRRLKVSTDDDDIIDIDEKYNYSEAYPYEIEISPLKSGTAVLHIVSDYDGLEQDVNINIEGNDVVVTYHNDSETVTQTETISSNFNLTKNTFTKTGYTFTGWNTKADGTGTSYDDEQEVNLEEDIDLYAQWEPITYTVIFNSNELVNNTSIQELTYDQSEKLNKNTFGREYYSFINWNTKPDRSGTSYEDEEEVLNLSSSQDDVVNLYAQWEDNSVYITFNSNTGSGSMNSFMTSSSTNSSLPENTFTKTGYKFKEWNTKADGSGTSYEDKGVINIDEDLALYAQWEPITYKIIFNSNDGTNRKEEQIITYNQSTKLRKNTFEKEGSTFKIWCINPDGYGVVYEDEKSVKNLSSIDNDVINLYAKWTTNEYIITIYKNDGTDEKVENHYNYHEEYEFYNAFSRMNYNFLYWEDIDTGDKYYNDDTFIITSNKEFNAIWEKNIFDITFDPYGNGESAISRSLSKNTPIYLFSVDNPDKEFLGWKDRDTNEFYEKNQNITPTDDMYLVGVWKEDTSTGYKINNYLVDEDNKYISKIRPNTSLNDYKSNFELSDGYSLTVKIKDGIIYTGGTTKVYKNNDVVAEYKNIVNGDINGDGEINSADLLKERQHLIGTITLKNEYFIAADINRDNLLNSADLLRIRQHLIGTKPIWE